MSAILGIVASSMCLYLALTYPIVRPHGWSGGSRFHIMVAITKYGTVAAMLLGGVAFIKSPKSALQKTLLATACSPAVVVIGLYILWLAFLS